ncbi:MAG: valine--tRNA ligase [Parcubacteria group bacterium CG1_02_58_44]|nr:MAG: valine--tRNA ligase [Parcubacteria group bacterium CG1_02_58_44]
MEVDDRELPKAYDPQGVEGRIYEAWEGSGFFNPDNLPGDRTEPFTIMMPPPNATGTLHIGHAMFLTLEDLMTRFHRMRGKAVLWLPGTDHAAIATNTKVEKILAKEGKTKYDLGRDGFIERVKEYIEGSRDTIRRQIRKMGSSCDWSREAFTFDEHRNRTVREMFVRMFDDGLIYRGYRIVNWCPRCESTLADDEVEYKEEPTTLFYMKYGPFTVATTRPETKLGDTAVAVHPEDARYRDMVGQTFEVDFGIGPQQIRVIADGGVDMEFGTGVVGITPAHSAVDFAMAERNRLPMKKVIGEDGKMTALAGKYAGLPVAEARAKLVAELKSKGLMEKEEEMSHKLSVCYRCSTAIEPLTSRQWFVDVNRPVKSRGGKTLKEMSLGAVRSGGIKILPEQFEKVYFNWMDNLHDWCVSRQIWFGHRIPVWYCRSCYVEQNAPERVGDSSGYERVGQAGVIASIEPPSACPQCGATDLSQLVQDTDTLDTWFSSGTWTFSTLGWPDDQNGDLKKFHPTQCLETGYDILFFWIARMILMTEYALGEVPFETVYLHGLVRTEDGQKMSKSLGNIIDPLEVAEKYGTDAVRLSLTVGNSPGNDLKMSEDKIAYYRNFANKLWNVARFIRLNSNWIEAQKLKESVPQPKTLADRWIFGRLDAVITSVTADIEAYNFSRPGETLRDFTWNELADWYLEIAKVEKRPTDDKLDMLRYLLLNVLKLWHPFMPFVTEEIYRNFFASSDVDFLMVAEWPQASGVDSGNAETEFALLQELVVAARNLRSEAGIEAGKRLEWLAVEGGEMTSGLVGQVENIGRLVRAEEVRFEERSWFVVAEDCRIATTSHGMQVAIPVGGGSADAAAFREKQEKELAAARQYAEVQRRKLDNADFVARAPAAVIETERRKLSEVEDRVAKLEEQLKSLS